MYPSREEIVAELYGAYLARQERARANKVDDPFKERALQWANLEGESELYDNEHGIRFYITERPNYSWDLREASPDLILWLAKEGLLDVKTSALDKRNEEISKGTRAYKPGEAMWLGLVQKHRIEGTSQVTHLEKVD